MKIKTTLMLLLAGLFLTGNMLVKAQPGENWNVTPAWNTGKDYRGIAYNHLHNHLYVAGSTDANDASQNIIRVLDASTGAELSQLTLAPLTVSDNGYGITDVEVSMDGGVFATTTTTNPELYNPFNLFYWESESEDPVLLWQNTDAYDFGPGFSVYGDYKDEALIIIPIYDIATILYFEVIGGVLGEPTVLPLNGVSPGTGVHVQALGTKIT